MEPKAQTARREKSNGANLKSQPTPSTQVAEPTMPSVPTSRTGLVEYPFPLREGRFAYLRLPADLTPGDVPTHTSSRRTASRPHELSAGCSTRSGNALC